MGVISFGIREMLHTIFSENMFSVMLLTCPYHNCSTLCYLVMKLSFI